MKKQSFKQSIVMLFVTLLCAFPLVAQEPVVVFEAKSQENLAAVKLLRSPLDQIIKGIFGVTDETVVAGVEMSAEKYEPLVKQFDKYLQSAVTPGTELNQVWGMECKVRIAMNMISNEDEDSDGDDDEDLVTFDSGKAAVIVKGCCEIFNTINRIRPLRPFFRESENWDALFNFLEKGIKTTLPESHTLVRDMEIAFKKTTSNGTQKPWMIWKIIHQVNKAFNFHKQMDDDDVDEYGEFAEMKFNGSSIDWEKFKQEIDRLEAKQKELEGNYGMLRSELDKYAQKEKEKMLADKKAKKCRNFCLLCAGVVGYGLIVLNEATKK